MYSQKKLFFAIGLIAVGIVTRYLLRDIPNVETITAVTIVAGSLLGGVWGMIVGVATVAGSDMFIGNTSILYYTWSAWAMVGAVSLMTRLFSTTRTSRRVLAMTGVGLVSNLVFFAWTNFGVWHIGGLYPHTGAGLLESYIMALPFLRNQLLSTVVFVPAFGAAAIALWNAQSVRRERVAAVVATRQ